MATFLRRIVSGPKARHVDKELGVDLDLVYLTDRLIVMGWPGSNLEVLFRNKRSTVRKFLDSRHGEDYRVFNLCPCWENSYEASEFYGEVGRYPFPDHHPPPLSMIPMFVCDITAWLAAKPKNVAVIHCKAGKGRSGTMACSYLLSLPVVPTAKDSSNVERRSSVDGKDTPQSPEPAEEMMGNLLAEHPDVKEEMRNIQGEGRAERAQAAKSLVGDLNEAYTPEALAQRLCSVFEFHTSKRLKKTRSSIESRRPSFLDEDPSSTSSSPLRQAKSVSNLVRKASRGIFHSNAEDGDVSPAHGLSGSATPNFAISPIGTPSRNSVSSSSQKRSPIAPKKSQVDLRLLGVQPMGRSVVDLKNGEDSQIGFTATVQGWSSTPHLPNSLASEGRRVSSLIPTKLYKDDLNQQQSTLAPPVFSPGQKVQASLHPSSSSVALPFSSNNHSQVSFGGPSADESESESDDENSQSPIRLAVSIPSQRRFVGYWARILSGNDARADVPSRKVRITRIQIDRKVKEDQQDSKFNSGSVSIHLGRYEPGLEARLRTWETSARRRTRAFGFTDPSAATPEFPPLRSNSEDEQWRHIERQNSGEQAYSEKLSVQGASFWGINVLAEQERVKNFAWVNSGHDDLVDKVAQMEESKKETEISTFASIREHSRSAQKDSVIRHNFPLSESGFVQDGAPIIPHWMKVKNGESSSKRISSSNDTSPSGSSMWVATGPTPPTSVDSERNSNDGITSDKDGICDVIVDADNALQVKMLVGRSGASHAHLPDIASCGYVWFIPSFESPSVEKGGKVKRTFSAQEIDFRKGKQVSKILGGEIKRLIVEWEWVDIGEEEGEEG